MRYALLSSLALALAACGGSADVGSHTTSATTGTHGASSGSSGTSASSTSTTTTGGGTTTGSATSTSTSSTGGSSGTTGDGCSDQAKLVYAVDVDNTLYAFHAGNSPSFTPIGTLNCPAPSGETPFSMSVDRSATAWVLYSDGEIFKVSTTDASCSSTNYQSGQHNFYTFGMGFVSDTNGGTTDTLFIANSGELGTLSTTSLQVNKVGTLNGQPELTGTGSAQLWGFYPDANNPRVAELDKTNGSELGAYPLSALAGQPEDWAFAFWGGDFWIFLKRDTDNSTNVWRVNGQTGAVQEVMDDTHLHIVGAGVSTCAPVVFN